MLKLSVCVVFISLVLDATASDEFEDELSNFQLPCLSFGGICVPEDDCPKDKQSLVKGLCPLQRKIGVECCHSLPISETRCRRRGGECFPKNHQCPENLTFNEASDCADDEKCCYLVN